MVDVTTATQSLPLVGPTTGPGSEPWFQLVKEGSCHLLRERSSIHLKDGYSPGGSMSPIQATPSSKDLRSKDFFEFNERFFTVTYS